MGCDLQHAVRAGVEDRLAGLQVLLTQSRQDFGAGGGDVADEFHPAALFQFRDQFGWKRLESREGLVRPAAHQLPVTGRRVLARRFFGEPRPGCIGMDFYVIG